MKKDEFLESLDYSPPWEIVSNYSPEELDELFRLARLGASVEAQGYQMAKLITPLNITCSYINKDKK